MALVTGTLLGAYKILALLGTGGMGEVYQARDNRLDRTVALKILPVAVAADKERMQRFIREAKAASALNHPHVATIYEIGAADGVSFIAMEYVEGQSLTAKINGAPLAIKEIVELGSQIADALDEAHNKGITHRDIKPANVMLTPRGQVKVLDFGLAKIARPQSIESDISTLAQTTPGVVMGTVPYMSPEQALGREVDHRSDIFSLGAVLYEMATGRLPFTGASTSETLDRILHAQPEAMARFNYDVPAELERIINKALRKDREQRYQTSNDLLIDLQDLKEELAFAAKLERSGQAAPEETAQGATATTEETITVPTTSSTKIILSEVKRHKLGVGLAVAIIVIATLGSFFWFNRKPTLTNKDTILLTDFDNKTGEEIFDVTLKQGLVMQLQKSQFLSLFPDDRVRQTLRQMGRSPNERVTAEIGREICERQHLKALIVGSIAPLGSHYILTLNVLNAQNSESLALQQIEAESKEQVLPALSQVAIQLHEKLGESLSLIQKNDKPLLQATTSKLEALRDYTLGTQQAGNGKIAEAIPFMKRAVEIDPNFAFAHTQLAAFYNATARPEAAGEYAKKAYALKEQVSENDQLLITYRYHLLGTGEGNKAVEEARLIKQLPGGKFVGAMNLTLAYNFMGQYEQAMTEAREVIRMNPKFGPAYWNLGTALLRVNRFAEAKDIFKQALEQQLEPANMQIILHQIACIEGDTAVMQQQVDWLKGKPEEYIASDLQTGAAAFAGQWRKAQGWSRQAMDLNASYDDTKELPARYATEQALRGAVLGDCRQAGIAARQGLKLTRNRTSLPRAALALALCGAASQTKSFADDLTKLYPEDTLINSIWLPLLRAAIELQRGNAAQAIEQLQATSRYEAAAEFWPQYLRGQAYLQLKKSAEATAEFQKILDHRGWSPTSALYVPAHVWLARAASMQGDTAKARKEYQDFLALWKDADADLQILMEAKKEYEKLK